MFRIDNSTAAAVLPTPLAPGVPGYFSAGNPISGTPATVVDADWLNFVQEELIAFLVAAGIAPDRTNLTQVLAACRSMFAGRLWVFANTGTLVVPAGITKLKFTVWGGGASGASTADGNYLGGGGGGGGYGEGLYDVTPGASLPITVGNGGANANAGQASSVGSFISALGGNPGWAGSSAGIGIGGTGGGVTGAQVAIPGRAGSGGIYYGNPGGTVEGGNGGGAYGGQPVRAVGAASGVVPGVPGSFPGGGGSGGSGVAGAGAGAKGLVIVGG
nr:hypothetical protein [uncultured Roseococcus sp.]